MGEAINVRLANRVAVCTLDHEPSRNSLGALGAGLVETLERLDGDEAVGAIVLTGSGDYFASGPDVRTFAAGGEIPADATMKAFWERLAALGKPLVGAVNGWALSSGFELALACDLLVVAKDATLGLPEITYGLIPSGGATQRLTRIVGRQRTMELVLSGRPLSGKQAGEWGLANVVKDRRAVVDSAVLLAEQLADRPPLAIRYAKQAVRAAEEVGLAEGLEEERRRFADALATEDRVEGIGALLEGRQPDFRGR